jgi:hypothetical protein
MVDASCKKPLLSRFVSCFDLFHAGQKVGSVMGCIFLSARSINQSNRPSGLVSNNSGSQRIKYYAAD